MARILVVEDDSANLELITYLLEAFGHLAVPARDGETGLAAARREAPDLIACDMRMPRMDGYEMARCLKADPKLRAIPLVAVTAFAMVGDRDKVLGAGFDGYIAKPIAPETFVEELNAFLRLDLRAAPLQTASPETPTAAAAPRAPRWATIRSQYPMRLLRPHTRDDGEGSWRRS